MNILSLKIAKLLAFLYERYKAFNGDIKKGMVIVPTELITDNGSKLQSIVIELAHLNKCDYAFIDWLENANCFCNSLVDRIVPGKLPSPEQKNIETKLGYKDDLMIMSEAYRLWAIESSNPKVKDALSFARADDGVIYFSVYFAIIFSIFTQLTFHKQKISGEPQRHMTLYT